MADLSMTWTVTGAGWADVTVADLHSSTTIVISYVTPAPEQLLTALTRLLHGDAQARVHFEAEPAVYRWYFSRDGADVSIRLLEHPDDRRPGTEIWSTRQPLGTIARVTVRCFDAVAELGEDEYERRWRRPFPRFELEGLRIAWRGYEAA